MTDSPDDWLGYARVLAAAVASSAVAAWGVVKLWLKRMQSTQGAHGRDLRRLMDRVTRLEASQEALTEALARIEGMIRALDGRMASMTQELGRVAGRLEGRQ